jgi:DNA adenine methylase
VKPKCLADLAGVNVRSVPQYSPFRYPGGKTWLVPYVHAWLKGRPALPSEFIEPFAGGASVGLSVAFARLADKVHLTECDPDVAAVWNTVLNCDAVWLAEQILHLEINGRTVRRILEGKPRSEKSRALRALVLNRVRRGGIMAPRAGILKRGERGRGLVSRWYGETLHNRVLAIHALRERISFTQGDGTVLIRANAGRSDVAFFIDPPYATAGRRLYSYYAVDHAELFALLSASKADFLMTYEDNADIRALVAKHGYYLRSVVMRNSHHATRRELLIERDVNNLKVERT